jgi:hypothetical protein
VEEEERRRESQRHPSRDDDDKKQKRARDRFCVRTTPKTAKKKNQNRAGAVDWKFSLPFSFDPTFREGREGKKKKLKNAFSRDGLKTKARTREEVVFANLRATRSILDFLFCVCARNANKRVCVLCRCFNLTQCVTCPIEESFSSTVKSKKKKKPKRQPPFTKKKEKNIRSKTRASLSLAFL